LQHAAANGSSSSSSSSSSTSGKWQRQIPNWALALAAVKRPGPAKRVAVISGGHNNTQHNKLLNVPAEGWPAHTIASTWVAVPGPGCIAVGSGRSRRSVRVRSVDSGTTGQLHGHEM
jgi:hypothetical protein